MHHKKPVIGVTGPVKGGGSAWWFTAFAVWLQGGKPVRIHPKKPHEGVALDGLILGGGADINPERYGELLEEPAGDQPKTKGFRHRFIHILSVLFYPFLFLMRTIFSAKRSDADTVERDELELNLLEDACKRCIPILGICRGAQLINVKFGGTLHQDIGGFYTEVPNANTVWPRKMVSITEKSLLFSILQVKEASVNALHHQAVDKIADQIKVTAQEQNGIVQGIEHPGFDYLIGVQWHPEYMPQIFIQRNIFKELVSKAAECKRKKENIR